MIHTRFFNAMAAVLAAVALCAMAVPSVTHAESEDESETVTTVTSGPAYLQVCTDAWASAPINNGHCATDGAVARHAYNDANHPGKCQLKGVNCNLGGITLQGTSFVHTFHDYEAELNLSPADTEALDMCIGITNENSEDGYYGELKAGCTADETDSSTAKSQGIRATQYFIDEEAALNNPNPDPNTGGIDSNTQAAINRLCNTAWGEASAEDYCSAEVSATANGVIVATSGFSDTDFKCTLTDVDCSVDITVDNADGTGTATDYTVKLTTSYTAESLTIKKLDLCLEAEDDPEDGASGYEASLQVDDCVYTAEGAKYGNLPAAH